MNTPKISFLSRFLNALSPPRCAVCGRRMTVGEHLVCARCNLRLPRTHYELTPYDNHMARMFWGRFAIEKCTSLFYYSPQSASSRLIIHMKYYHHPEYGYRLGQMMAHELLPSGFFDGVTAIMPIPLARNRERKRGFNQSREIARGLCDVTRLPLIDNAVTRAKFIDSQTHKSHLERSGNVEGVFTLCRPDLVGGHHILLVDDIVTTGATVTSCAREIIKAGNVKISVLTAGFAGR